MISTSNETGILYVDIEGGWGGSSRSLYYLIKHLDKGQYKPVVLLGKHGPIEKHYQLLGIDAFVFSPIPRTTAMEKNNLRSMLLFMLQLVYLPSLLHLMRSLIKNHNVTIIHLNHESLFFLGLCCKIFFRSKIIYHVRTMLPDNNWTRIQILTAVFTADHLVFITENERDRWHTVYPKSAQLLQSVIHNIADPMEKYSQEERLQTVSGKFKVISLMTLSYKRGIDRLVDVGLSLKNRDCKNIVFIICGRSDNELYEKNMKQKIQIEDIDGYFLFLGHHPKPESILAECDVLIRPSREYNPWGRDVIEALVMGKPVIAIGTYDKFIEDGVNGYLFPEFDAGKMAEKIIYLSEHPEVIEKMRKANMEKAKRLFDGPTNAAKVAAIYDSLVE